MTPRRWFAALLGRGRIWLILDQVASSAGNALPLLLASVRLSTGELASLALAFLLATTAVTFHRAVLLDPSLSVMGGLAVRWHGVSTGVISALTFGLSAACLALLTGVATGLPGALVTLAAAAIACFQDFLRYRALHASRQRLAFGADTTWALLAIAGVFAVPASWESVMVVWASGAAVSVGFLVFRDRRPRRPGLLREALSRGRFQVAEVAVASLLTVVPMFLGTALGWDARIAAIRLAQSATGPLNAIHSAVTLAVMTRSQEIVARQADEIAHVHRRVRRVVLVAALPYVLVASAVLLLMPVAAAEVADSLPLVLAIVGSSVILTSISSPVIVFLRAFGHQDWVLWTRMTIVGIAGLLTTTLLLWLPEFVDPATAMIGLSALIGLPLWQYMLRKLFRSIASSRAAD